MNALARFASETQRRLDPLGDGAHACQRASLAVLLLGGVLAIALAPPTEACSFGPTYNSCMQEQEEQQQMRAEQERQREEQQQQQAEQQQRMEQQQREQQQREQQQRMEQQQREQQAQQEQQRRIQQQQQAEQQRTQQTMAHHPAEPRPQVGVPREPMANRPASASFAPHSGVPAQRPLSRAGSQSVLHQVNSARAGLSGINRRPIPSGLVTRHRNGVLSVSASGGRQFTLRPNGTLSSLSVHGRIASFRADGHLARLHTGRMDIVYSPRGGRTVIVHGPGRSLIVSTGPHRGYVQRDVVLHGQRFLERTVIIGRTRTVRLYGTYTFHGVALTYYVPHYYYAPAFYGWAYYPWVVPVAYAWPWVSAPWYAAYGPYFVASPVYVGPYDWLTDYYLSQTLADEYAAQAAAAQAAAAQTAAQSAALESSEDYVAETPDGSSPGGSYAAADTPITPEIKQAIAQEVRQQLAAENSAAVAQGGAPAIEASPSAAVGALAQALQPHHLFIVAADLSATTADEEACSLSAGNVLQLAAAPAPDSAVADLTVMSSRRTDCPAGTHVALSLDSLAEMQNAFSARLDDGLAALRQQQGGNGIPAAPPSAIAPPPRPADYPPPNEQNAAAMLDSAQQQANQAAASVTAQAFAVNTAS